jgi:DNA end-binding protein Ku
VALAEINPMYFHKPFYLEPSKAGAKAYVLLREALANTGKVGIAKVVIKTRQYLAAVKPNEKGLVLELMHFANELVGPDELHLPSNATVSKGELDMAKALVERMTDAWHPDKYKDDYKSALMELIEKKMASGGRTTRTAPQKARPTTNVIDSHGRSAKEPGNLTKNQTKAGPAAAFRHPATQGSVAWIRITDPPTAY